MIARLIRWSIDNRILIVITSLVVAALAVGGLAIAYGRTTKDLRARNLVERGVLVLLMLALAS